MTGSWVAALLLADGRFPTGGHVHSAGVESAVADGRISDVDSLAAYVRGRLATVALTDAALAAATVVHLGRETTAAVAAALDDEAEARVTVPALRAASRRLGRQLVRVAGGCWRSPVLAVLHPDPHQPVALGAVGLAAGLGVTEVATLAVHHAVAAPSQAAVRLLGLDPFAVAALQASFAAEADPIVAEAIAAANGALDELPARTGPLAEIAAADHAGWDSRLFAT